MLRETALNRRCFLGQSAAGLGAVALASLSQPELFSAGTASLGTIGPGVANAPGVSGFPESSFDGVSNEPRGLINVLDISQSEPKL